MKPLAISMGDPAGVGPELLVKLFKSHQLSNFVLCGDVEYFSSLLGDTRTVNVVSAPADAKIGYFNIYPVNCEALPVAGEANPANARATKLAIEAATRFVMNGEARALVTLPIHKANLAKGTDFPYPGHTEFLAHLAGVEHTVMMLASDELKTVPATIHIPISEVPNALNKDILTRTIEITHTALRALFKIETPRLAVAGLNPHAGENGRIGCEEIEFIDDVIKGFVNAGMQISGPLPADTMFHARARAQYDAAICMYHDQALIPIKTLSFDEGVNITLGMPFLRTSPDHGTAYDIAGRDIARPDSLYQAILYADRLSQ